MKTPAYYFLKGEANHWRSCCLLYHDYARRKNAAYTDFQAECIRRNREMSVSHLRFMMGAYLTYLELCKDLGSNLIAPLRRQLPYTYFARAGQTWRAQDLKASDVYYVLSQAGKNEVKNSNQVQDALIAEAFTNGDTSGEMHGRQWIRTEIYPTLLRFSETPPVDVPAEIVFHAREFVRLSAAWMADTY